MQHLGRYSDYGYVSVWPIQGGSLSFSLSLLHSITHTHKHISWPQAQTESCCGRNEWVVQREWERDWDEGEGGKGEVTANDRDRWDQPRLMLNQWLAHCWPHHSEDRRGDRGHWDDKRRSRGEVRIPNKTQFIEHPTSISNILLRLDVGHITVWYHLFSSFLPFMIPSYQSMIWDTLTKQHQGPMVQETQAFRQSDRLQKSQQFSQIIWSILLAITRKVHVLVVHVGNTR